MRWLFLLLALFGCSQSSNNSKNMLRLSITHDISTLDPTKNADYVCNTLFGMLYEGLTRPSIPEPEPAAASAISLSSDKLTYTFKLRDRAKWSDGAPVTAYDFEYAWKLQLSPTYPAPDAYLLYPIKGAKEAKEGKLPIESVGIYAKDAKTLIVTLEKPTPYFLEITAYSSLYPIPKHIASKKPGWAMIDDLKLVCNGPFYLHKWSPNSKLVLKKNGTYWNSKKTTLPAVEIAVIGNSTTALSLYRKGELDILGLPFNNLPLDAIESYKDELYSHPAAGTSFCAMNLSHPLLKNQNIRKALALAVNRKDIIENVLQQGEEIATSPIPSVFKKSDFAPFFSDSDTALAKKLFSIGLDELGMSRNEVPELALLYRSDSEYSRIALVMQEQWKKSLGLKVNLKQVDLKMLYADLVQRKFDMAYFIWIAQFNDQMDFLERFCSKENKKNYPGWENATFTRLLQESATAKTEKERFDLLSKAEHIFVDEMPAIPLYHWKKPILINERVDGDFLIPYGPFRFELAKLEQRK